MRAVEFDLLSVDTGAITAPAGCGKTHLIADALGRNDSGKPILVLTHSNAGVAALRGRLDDAGVERGQYRIFTIDGWAMRLVATFPMRSACDPNRLLLAKPNEDYVAIRQSAVHLIKSRHIDEILRASYSRLLVDEYQDCTRRQHELVVAASAILSTEILGDPLQAIFGFGSDDLPGWSEVLEAFPLIGELSTPWRWINVGSDELGYWLLDVRQKLINGEAIELTKAPPSVTWVALGGGDDHARKLRAAATPAREVNGSVLIIGDGKRPESQRQIASQTPGAITVEAVDLRDLVRFAKELDLRKPGNALLTSIYFAASVMTNVGAENLIQRLKSLVAGTARTEATQLEQIALTFLGAPSVNNLLELFEAIGKEAGVSTHRPVVLRSCIKALQACDIKAEDGFLNAVLRMREENRLAGRPLPHRAVGSTLLLKGLEAEVVAVLETDLLDAKNLYVALTRGSTSVVVCSRSSTIQRPPVR